GVLGGVGGDGGGAGGPGGGGGEANGFSGFLRGDAGAPRFQARGEECGAGGSPARVRAGQGGDAGDPRRRLHGYRLAGGKRQREADGEASRQEVIPRRTGFPQNGRGFASAASGETYAPPSV